MISEVLALAIQIVTFLWPFRIVKEGETGQLYIFGRWVRELAPGCYFIVPFFMEIDIVSIAWDPVRTGRLDLFLADDTPISFEVRAMARVKDARKMLRELDDYRDTARTILASVVAERLGQVRPERIGADGRGRLFADLRRWVQEEADQFGLEIAQMRFTSLVLKPRTYRILGEEKEAA
jgi:regulator of protease activity HflC (stomatin/prohibitin superfamily)